MIVSGMNKKPILYHSTPNRIEGDQLMPNLQGQKTCVHYQFEGTSKQSEHEGPLLFAGTNQGAAYAYAFKLLDPNRMEGAKPYCFMCSTGVHNLKDGSSVPFSIIADRPAFFERLKHSSPTIYKIPANNAFQQVHDKDGNPMGEWVSKSPVDIARCVTAHLTSMDEAMEKGVQFFFLADGITKERWNAISQPGFEAIRKKLAPYESDPTVSILAFIKEMVNAGVLVHYNQERGIMPLNLETQTLPSITPLSFTKTIPTPNRFTLGF